MTQKTPLILLFLLIVAAAQLAQASADPLWQQAVEMGRRNRTWVPGEARAILELVDDSGAVKDIWESLYRITPGPDGKLSLEVVRELHNGVEAKSKQGRRPFSAGDDPFDPAVQDSVDARSLGESRLIDGVTCSLFAFSLRKKDGTKVVGTAWLTRDTGAPVEASYTYEPLPKGVFEMSATLRYGRGPQGEGALREVHIEGAGGILFIRKSFRSTITLDAYRPA